MQIIQNLAVFAAVLGFLVFIHEWGHYYAYKKAGVKIREFSIGIGPGYTFTRKNGEKWKLSPFLIGGYVMPENIKARGGNAPQRGDVEYARPWQRFVAALAGPAVNIVAAVVLISAALMLPRPDYKADIGNVVAASPAAVAGLQVGDRITAINGAAVNTLEEAFSALRSTQTVTLTVQRGGETVQLVMARGADGNYGLGFEQKPDGKRAGLSFTQAVPASVVLGYTTVINTFDGIGKMVTGNIAGDQIAGPAKFGGAVSQVSSGGLAPTLMFLGMLSLVLGIFNLLPVPPLDGGHLVKEGLAMAGVTVPQKLWQAIGTLIGVTLFGATLLWLGWDVIGPLWQYTLTKVIALALVALLVYRMLFVVKE